MQIATMKLLLSSYLHGAPETEIPLGGRAAKKKRLF
jgi:hypothetical protein